MNAYLLALRHTPTILRRIVDDVPSARFDERLGEERFTLGEMVCHLADFERVFLDRMVAATEQDVPEFESVDVAARAREKGYAERDLHEELAVFDARRGETIAWLEGRSEADLAREFVQSFGRMSVKEFVAVLAGHDLYHVEQATWYLKGVHGKDS